KDAVLDLLPQLTNGHVLSPVAGVFRSPNFLRARS
ncbi:MAG: hypothetical protein RLZZ458_92, partial [Planctomycetota bacterium]